MQLWGVVWFVVVSCCSHTSSTFRLHTVLTILIPFPCPNSFYWIYIKNTATSGRFMNTTCAGEQLLSLKFCQDLHKYGYLAPCQIRSASSGVTKAPFRRRKAQCPRGGLMPTGTALRACLYTSHTTAPTEIARPIKSFCSLILSCP